MKKLIEFFNPYTPLEVLTALFPLYVYICCSIGMIASLTSTSFTSEWHQAIGFSLFFFGWVANFILLKAQMR